MQYDAEMLKDWKIYSSPTSGLFEDDEAKWVVKLFTTVAQAQ
jgi:hypothetical protein